jgi:predicted nucleotidyltransferase
VKDKGSIVRKLDKNGLIKGIKPFAVNTHYEVIMGSFAYGVSNTTSDMDVYGVFTPPIEYIFPHIAGFIRGFGEPAPVYDTYQKHHIQHNEKEYDLALYSIVKYFNLCADNNPNMIDSLFVPSRCIIHSDTVGDIIRENRKMFLHKGIQKRFTGYAYSQLNKLKTKKLTPCMKKLEDFESLHNILNSPTINTLEKELKTRGLWNERKNNE